MNDLDPFPPKGAEVSSRAEPADDKCPKCNDTQEIDCPDCVEGYVPCIHCNDTGMLGPGRECYHCNTPKECDNCSADGWIPCPEC